MYAFNKRHSSGNRIERQISEGICKPSFLHCLSNEDDVFETKMKTDDEFIAQPSTDAICTPHSAINTPHSAIDTPHSAIDTPHSAIHTPNSAILTPNSAILTPNSAILTPNSPIVTPHSAIHTPHSGDKSRGNGHIGDLTVDPEIAAPVPNSSECLSNLRRNAANLITNISTVVSTVGSTVPSERHSSTHDSQSRPEISEIHKTDVKNISGYSKYTQNYNSLSKVSL